MSKYIIKNCPAFCNDTCNPDDQWAVENGCLKYDDYCADNNCVLKQIVEKCKDSYGYLAREILHNLLDIQEVE